jgi:tRNA/rRNA methyltransferase
MSLPNLRIVLVEPREAGNVGAVARAMKNFGRRDLCIVGEVPQLQPVADWWASGAEDLIRAASRKPSLLDAVADAHVTIATTSSRGRSLAGDLDPASVAELFASLEGSQTLALVFGREDRGLTAGEMSFCQRTAIIPTDEGFPTMNLAQSVAIFCYALSGPRVGPPARGALADAALVERLHERAQDLLREAGFIRDDQIYDEMRALAGRMHLTEREATVLLGMIRQIEWKMRKHSL